MNFKYVITLLFSLSLMLSKNDCSQKNTAVTTINQSVESEMDLGKFSMSLAVKDLKTSYEFYQKLGFQQLEGAGGFDQNWMILINGTSKIGLFQGMFPNNTLTFNPKDGRVIFTKLKDDGIQFEFMMGMDKEEGACSFSIVDPDGNSILVDQH